MSTRSEVVITYAPHGAARELFHRRDGELLLSGPAGTGKSRACLEKMHLCASKYAGARMLMARKTQASLTSTAVVTYERKVLHPLDGVVFFGGSARQPAHYRYPNGSVVVVGGLNQPTRIMSAEYDLIYVPEATELVENDWESLTTRLRNGVMPYQQLLGDCNPGAPTHWLKQRADAGTLAMLESRHEDNPALWDGTAWTAEGAAYIARLDGLSGVRKARLRHGRWAAAEGLVYEQWDRARHLIDPFPIPAAWPRYLVIDFGYTNPFVCQWWAGDPDGRLFRYRELYRTRRLVEHLARDIARLCGAWGEGGVDWSRAKERPVAVVCDHDAEGRATLEHHLKLKTTAAKKAIGDGIQKVQARLETAGDGRPRLFLLRDATVERDDDLAEALLPTCTEDEIEGYVWDTSAGRKRGELPVDLNNHGCDALRYMVAHLDGGVKRWRAF